MKQLLVQYKFEVKWDVMHKLDTFVSFFQPSGDFLSFSFFDQKKKKKIWKLFFFLPTGGSLAIFQ